MPSGISGYLRPPTNVITPWKIRLIFQGRMVVSNPLIRPYLSWGVVFLGEGILDLTGLGYIMKIKYL